MADIASNQAHRTLIQEEALGRVFSTTGLIAFYAGLLVFWELAVDIFSVPSYFLPSPLAIGQWLFNDIVYGNMLHNLRVTLVEVFGGFALATLIGMTIGLLIAEVKFIDRAVFPLMVVLQCTPKIAWAPLIVIWMGFGIETKIVTAAAGAVLSGISAYGTELRV